jgi:hypothetical protein
MAISYCKNIFCGFDNLTIDYHKPASQTKRPKSRKNIPAKSDTNKKIFVLV